MPTTHKKQVPFLDCEEFIERRVAEGELPQMTYGEAKFLQGVAYKSPDDEEPLTHVQWQALQILAKREQPENPVLHNSEYGGVYRAKGARGSRKANHADKMNY